MRFIFCAAAKTKLTEDEELALYASKYNSSGTTGMSGGGGGMSGGGGDSSSVPSRPRRRTSRAKGGRSQSQEVLYGRSFFSLLCQTHFVPSISPDTRGRRVLSSSVVCAGLCCVRVGHSLVLSMKKGASSRVHRVCFAAGRMQDRCSRETKTSSLRIAL